jgi:hypothetical protein
MGCLLWWRFSGQSMVVGGKEVVAIESERRTLDREGFVRSRSITVPV